MPIPDQTAKNAFRNLVGDAENWSLDALIFGTNPSSDDSVLQRFNVREAAHEDLLSGLRSSINTYHNKDRDGLLEFRPWEAGQSPESHQLMIADVEEIGIDQMVDDLLNPGGIPLAADETEIPWGDFTLEIRVVSINGNRSVFLRKATKATFLRNKKPLVFRAGNLERELREMVAIESNFDAVICDGIVFMKKPAALETLFELREELRGQADHIVGQIVDQFPIEGVEELVESASRHWQMLRKLHHIQKQEYLNHITMDDIVEVVNRRNLPIVVAGEGENRRLSYDASNKWAILRLLDDDYLVSELTQRAYEVKDRAKTRLSDDD